MENGKVKSDKFPIMNITSISMLVNMGNTSTWILKTYISKDSHLQNLTCGKTPLIMEMHGMKSIMLIFVEEMQAVRSVIRMNKQSKLFWTNLKNQILLISGGLTTKGFTLSQLIEELLGPMNTQIIIQLLDISSYGVKVLIWKSMEELLSDWTT